MLSIQQPWAWLIANGKKDIENRSWPTKIRGPFLLHAGKRFDEGGWAFVRLEHPEITDLPNLGEFDMGGIVGEARLVDCVRASRSPWFYGPYGFVIADARPLPFFRMQGKLGLFKVMWP